MRAATDSYIYTFRGFSISRFVECSIRTLSANNASAHRGFVSVRSCEAWFALSPRKSRARAPAPIYRLTVARASLVSFSLSQQMTSGFCLELLYLLLLLLLCIRCARFQLSWATKPFCSPLFCSLAYSTLFLSAGFSA